MRPGFLLAMIGFGALVVLALIFIPPKAKITGATEPGPASANEGARRIQPLAEGEADLAEPAKLNESHSSTNAQAISNASRRDEPAAEARKAQHEARVAAQVAELQNLSNKKDITSLQTLLSEVRNRDPEIRQAALDALSQSGNRGAIPGLQEAAAQAEDAGEKQAIGEVIEFLKLPTLTEIMREQRATTNNNNARPDGP